MIIFEKCILYKKNVELSIHADCMQRFLYANSDFIKPMESEFVNLVKVITC